MARTPPTVEKQHVARQQRALQLEPRQPETLAGLPVLTGLQMAAAEQGHARPADLLALQRLAGNRAVNGLIQAKLRVGPVGDRYELEADRVAEQVLGMQVPANGQGSGTKGQSSVQREDEGQAVQTKPLAASITPIVQRAEEEEQLQAKPLIQRAEEEEELQAKPLIQRAEEEEQLQAKPLVQRAEEEEQLQAKPLVQRAEEEEELQAKPLVQRAEEEEQLQAKPLVQRAEEEEELQAKPLVQRAEEEEELQAKPLIQRAEEEEQLQTKSVERQADGSFEAGAGLEGRLAANKGGGSPLPGSVREFMEPRFGADFGGVRVHTGTEAMQMNSELKSQAFTHGQDIYMGADRYNPGSTEGKRLLAHELTHSIQQGASPPVRRQRGKSQSHPSKVHTRLYRSIIQRNGGGGDKIANEELLTPNGWAKATSAVTNRTGELVSIDNAVQAYAGIEQSKENLVPRLLALEELDRVVSRMFVVVPEEQRPGKLDDLETATRAKTRQLKEQYQSRFAGTYRGKRRQKAFIKKVVPRFYEIQKAVARKKMSKLEAAQAIFQDFGDYRGFSYVTRRIKQTMEKGLYLGNCEDYSLALAYLFKQAGIDPNATVADIGQNRFMTKTIGPRFIDKRAQGNVKMEGKGYTDVKRFMFFKHFMTTSAVGDWDVTAGVRGNDAIDPNLTGFQPASKALKDTYGLTKSKNYYIHEAKGMLFEVLLGDAPSGSGYLYRALPEKVAQTEKNK